MVAPGAVCKVDKGMAAEKYDGPLTTAAHCGLLQSILKIHRGSTTEKTFTGLSKPRTHCGGNSLRDKPVRN